MIDNIPILIINLKRHLSKYKNAYNILIDTGLNENNISRFEAINGDDIQDVIEIAGIYTQFLIDNPEYRCSHQQLNTKGGIGCFLSHKTCWEIYKDDKYGVLIFEDDLYIPDITSFKNKLNEYLIHLPPDCDVFSFGNTYVFDDSMRNKSKDELKKSKAFFFGTQGYYVTPNGIDKLLKYVGLINIHVDAYISLLAKLDLLNLYLLSHTLVKQKNSTKSSIQKGVCYKCNLPNSINMTYTYLLWIFLGISLIFIIALIVRIRSKSNKNI